MNVIGFVGLLWCGKKGKKKKAGKKKKEGKKKDSLLTYF